MAEPELTPGTDPDRGPPRQDHQPDTLPARPPASGDLLTDLLDQLRDGWRAGRPPTVAELVAPYPRLRANEDALLDLIRADAEFRHAAGRYPNPSEYAADFPELAGPVADLLARHEPTDPGFGPARPVPEGPSSFLAAPPPDRPSAWTDSIIESAGLEAASDAGQAAAAQPPDPTVPGYTIQSTLGRGGMGVVYRAIDQELNRPVALKMILAGGHAGPDALARFFEEARAVARLQHPNIVQVYEIGEADGLPFLALEYLAGGTLSRATAGEPQPARRAAGWVKVLAGALHAVHAAGIVHRDLKPANILLAADGTPKVTDFGLAKRLDSDEAGLTATGQVMGTPSYMAPEQAAGKLHQIGPATDVYALGAILYELLVGRPPFKGTAAHDTILQVLTQEPVGIHRLNSAVPRDLETICLKCLEKDPAKRYESGAALADDLGRFLDGRPVAARRAGPVERAVKWVRRSPLQAALAATVLVAVGAGVAAAVARAEGATARARASENETELARQKLADQERREKDRAQAERAFAAAQLAADGKDWVAADREATAALDLLAADTGLADAAIRGPTEQLRARARSALTDAAARKAARDRLARVKDFVGEAVVYQTLFTGLELAETDARTRAAVAAGLAAAGVRPDADGPPAPGTGGLAPDEAEDARAACGMLLVLDADALARPVIGEKASAWKGRLADALARLDRAAAAGFQPRPAGERRADLLAYLGQADPAEVEAVRTRAKDTPAVSAADFLLAGLDHFRRGEYPDANRDLAAALKYDPDSFPARYLRALVNVRLGRWVDARTGLDDCARRRPAFPWTYLHMGFAASEAGDYAAADADFAKVLGSNPEPGAEYVALVNRGESLARRGDVAAAVADFRKAVGVRPDDQSAYLKMAAARVRGTVALGGAVGPAAVEPADRAAVAAAVADLDAAAARRPTAPLVFHERGKLHLRRGDTAAARADFLKAVEQAASRGPESTLADDLTALGLLFYQEKNYPAALATYDEILKIRPDLVAVHRGRAMALLALGRNPEAGEAMERFLAGVQPPKSDPDRATGAAGVHLQRGLLHARAGDFRAAVESYTRGLAAGRDAELLAQRGAAYLTLGAPQLAATDFTEALALRPADPFSLGGRAEARVRLGKFPDALADAAEAARGGAGSPLSLYRAARAYAQVAAQLDAPRVITPARAAEVAAHRARAAELVGQAIDRTAPADRPAFWTNYVKADATLAAVRTAAPLARYAEQYDRGPTAP